MNQNMIQDAEDGRKKFELPGSKAHYAPSISFTIDHMALNIEPNFDDYTITCSQVLKVTALQDTGSIELDAAELQLTSVSTGNHNLGFQTLDEKLKIKLNKT